MNNSSITITLLLAVFASTGFWTFLTNCYNKRSSNVSAQKRALLGLLHDRIYELGNKYISDGQISTSDYENFICLYNPYHELGGNGTGTRIKKEVDELQIVNEVPHEN